MKDKRYIIIGTDRHGKHYGYVENSFNMGCSNNEVRVWAQEYKRAGSTSSDNQQTWNWLVGIADKLNRSKYQGLFWKAYRVGSKHCPVVVDFSFADKMKAGKRKYDKYWWRNQRFEDKEE